MFFADFFKKIRKKKSRKKTTHIIRKKTFFLYCFLVTSEYNFYIPKKKYEKWYYNLFGDFRIYFLIPKIYIRICFSLIMFFADLFFWNKITQKGKTKNPKNIIRFYYNVF